MANCDHLICQTVQRCNCCSCTARRKQQQSSATIQEDDEEINTEYPEDTPQKLGDISPRRSPTKKASEESARKASRKKTPQSSQEYQNMYSDREQLEPCTPETCHPDDMYENGQFQGFPGSADRQYQGFPPMNTCEPNAPQCYCPPTCYCPSPTCIDPECSLKRRLKNDFCNDGRFLLSVPTESSNEDGSPVQEVCARSPASNTRPNGNSSVRQGMNSSPRQSLKPAGSSLVNQSMRGSMQRTSNVQMGSMRMMPQSNELPACMASKGYGGMESMKPVGCNQMKYGARMGDVQQMGAMQRMEPAGCPQFVGGMQSMGQMQGMDSSNYPACMMQPSGPLECVSFIGVQQVQQQMRKKENGNKQSEKFYICTPLLKNLHNIDIKDQEIMVSPLTEDKEIFLTEPMLQMENNDCQSKNCSATHVYDCPGQKDEATEANISYEKSTVEKTPSSISQKKQSSVSIKEAKQSESRSRRDARKADDTKIYKEQNLQTKACQPGEFCSYPQECNKCQDASTTTKKKGKGKLFKL